MKREADEGHYFPDVGYEYKGLYTQKWENMDFVSSLMPKSGTYERIIMYIHGGAFALPSDPNHETYCDELAVRNNALVVAPHYGLAPKYCYYEAFNMLDDVYDRLISLNKPIIIAGDSAGGGLALSYTLYRKEQGKVLPSKVITLSPWLDATLSNQEIPQYDKKDHILASYALVEAGRWWSGDLPDSFEHKIPTTNYKISPINGDYKEFPEILTFFSKLGIFYPDGMKFIGILRKNNVKTTFVELNGFVHVASLYANFSEYNQLHQYLPIFLNKFRVLNLLQ